MIKETKVFKIVTSTFNCSVHHIKLLKFPVTLFCYVLICLNSFSEEIFLNDYPLVPSTPSEVNNPVNHFKVTLVYTKNIVEDIIYSADDFLSIGSNIFYDLNDNGFKDPDEQGVPFIFVKIVKIDDPKLFAYQWTDENGDYFFESLPEGTYTVTIGSLASKAPAE